MSHPFLFQINTRCWLRELSDAAGRKVTLANVDASHFESWRERGVTHVWLMGVWTSGTRARQQALQSEALRREFTDALPGWTDADVGGSPYAIAAYSVPRELGGDAGLKKFRQVLHKHGLKLVLDFVPNHVGLDHPWVGQQPDLFVQSDTSEADSFVGGSAASPLRLCHGRDPFFDPWTDTAQLDYRRADTRSMMTQELVQLAGRCDGLRCDMAMLLLNDVFAATWSEHPCRMPPAGGEFWADAIAAVREKHPNFLLLAEAYWNREPELLKLGFDFAYQKTLMDAIFDQPDAVQKVVAESTSWLDRGVHFLENHDERRVAARLDHGPHRAAALAVLSLPGLRLVQEGQLEGRKVRTPVQLVRRQPESPDPAVQMIYDQLLPPINRMTKDNAAAEVLMPRPAWEGNPTAQWFVIVQWHRQPDKFHLAVTNLAPHRSQCYVPLTVGGLATRDWQLHDLLGDQVFDRSGEELQAKGLYLDVAAHATQVFEFVPQPK